jgi:hypothetical protein
VVFSELKPRLDGSSGYFLFNYLFLPALPQGGGKFSHGYSGSYIATMFRVETGICEISMRNIFEVSYL